MRSAGPVLEAFTEEFPILIGTVPGVLFFDSIDGIAGVILAGEGLSRLEFFVVFEVERCFVRGVL